MKRKGQSATKYLVKDLAEVQIEQLWCQCRKRVSRGVVDVKRCCSICMRAIEYVIVVG